MTQDYLSRLPVGWTDLTDEDLKPPGYYLYVEDTTDNAAVFKRLDGKTAEGHFLFKVGGKTGRDSGRVILRRLFLETDIEVVVGKVPKALKPSSVMARLLGFTSHGLLGDDELFILTKKEFMNG